MSEQLRGIRVAPNADRVLIAAPTRGGKTTLIEYIAHCLQPIRTVLIDPKEAPELAHIKPIVHNVSELPDALRGPICHWIPEDVEDRADLTAGYAAIWRLHKCGARLIWDDEVADTTKPNWISPDHAKLIRRGAGWQQLYIAGTQRLRECHPVIRTQAEHIIALTPAPIDLDLDALAQHVQLNTDRLRELMDDLHEQAGDYSHLWYLKATREHRRMAACPPGPQQWRAHLHAPARAQAPEEPGADGHAQAHAHSALEEELQASSTDESHS